MNSEQPTNYFSDIQKDMRGPESRLASAGKRFANGLIDLIFFYVLSVLLGVFLALYGGIDGSDFDSANPTIIALVLYVIYFTVLEYTTGKTLGKLITKTHVVKEDGQKPDLQTIIIRTLCRFIPFDSFSFFGNKAVGWHDTVSKTRVINDDE